MTLSGFPRIVIDPAICVGRPIVAGKRTRVTDLMETLAHAATIAEIVQDFPYLVEADVLAALAYAATAVNHPVVLAGE